MRRKVTREMNSMTLDDVVDSGDCVQPECESITVEVDK